MEKQNITTDIVLYLSG